MNLTKSWPTLQTERLVMRIPNGDDARRMLDFQSRNKAHLTPWSPTRKEDFYTFPFWQRVVHRYRDEFQHDRAACFILLDLEEERVLGEANFRNIVRGVFGACHLGYCLDEEAQGKGLMYEALDALIRYMFEEQGLHRIMANYMPSNARSGRVLEKLGFRKEGVAREYLKINGAWEDHILTSLVAQEQERALEIHPITTDDLDWMHTQCAALWGGPHIVSRGEIHDVLTNPGWVCWRAGERVGALVYREKKRDAQILSVHSVEKRRGIGSALMERMVSYGREHELDDIWLITTNDNLDAHAFYARLGFRLTEVHTGAIEQNRALKPQIPRTGAYQLPLEDEWEYRLRLRNDVS